DGGGNAGRVLVNIKGVVEMRNAQAFEVQLRIEREVFGKIGFEQLVIFGLEDVERQRVAAFFDGVDDFFELRKHGLPKQCAAQLVDVSVDDVSAHPGIGGGLEQIVSEQFLVEGGGHLREENRIFVILKLLGILRKPTVHGVAGLVRQRVHVGKNVLLVIHQDVGRRAVTAGGKRAAAFAFG